MKDILNTLHSVVAIVPQTQTNSSTAIVGEIIDRQGFDSVCFFIGLGTLTDADATFAVSMEEGNDSALADTGAVAAGDLVGTTALAAFDFAADKKTRKLGYKGMKRYLRLTITPTNNDAGAAPVSAIAILGHGNVVPPPNPPQ